MNNTIKCTHFIAKTNEFMKNLSSFSLKEVCNCSLSFAFNRLRNGLGLVSLYDQETLKMLAEVITRMRSVTSPVPIIPDAYKKVMTTKRTVVDSLEAYRRFILRGAEPIYIHQVLREKRVVNAYAALSSERELVDVRKELTDIRRMLLQKDEKSLADEYRRIVKEAPTNSTEWIPYYATYMIRTSLDDKQSCSKDIRRILDGIFDIPSKTSEQDREILAADLKVLEMFIARKKKLKKIYDKENKTIKEKMSLRETSLKIPGEMIQIMNKIELPKYTLEGTQKA